MPISAVNLGTDSTVGIGATGHTVPSGTFVDIGGITNISLNVSHNLVDTTNNDDNGFTSNKYGNTTVTLSIEGRFDPSDAAQATLRTVAADLDGSCKVVKAFCIRPIVGSGEDSWSFEGNVSSFETTGGNDEPVNFTAEIQATGQPTYAAQT